MRNAVKLFVFGILLLINGLVFFFIDKPDPVYSFYIGPLCIAFGVIIWIKLGKNHDY